MTGRTDSASRLVAAPAAAAYAAQLDPGALAEWLPPDGMALEVQRLEPRPGGAIEMVLTYVGADPTNAKSGADRDVVRGRFVALEPGRRVVQDMDFVSDDPAYSGTMRMTWDIVPEGAGTRVTVTAENVPPGISAEDHAAGLNASLANLARHLEAPLGRP